MDQNRADINAQIKDLGSHWEAFARLDPMWAILTAPDTRGNRWNPREFFESGRTEVRMLRAELERSGLTMTGHRALDFGCGVGRVTQALCAYFDEVIGVDVSPTMVDHARKANRFGERCRYLVNDRSDLRQFTDSHFDFLYSAIVLQHVGAELAHSYIEEFTRIVRPGGVGVFQIPSRPTPMVHDGGAESNPTDERMFSASYRAVEFPDTVRAGSFVRVTVEVRNTSPVSWHPREVGRGGVGRGCIRLGASWLDADTRESLGEEPSRADIAAEVPPTESVVLELFVLAPTIPGRFLLKLGLMCELIAWFEEREVAPLILPMKVVSSDSAVAFTAPGGDGNATMGPTMVMEGVLRQDVEALLEANGARIVDVRSDDFAGDGWESFTYVFIPV